MSYRPRTNDRVIDGKVFDLYATAKNPFEAEEKVKKAEVGGYNYHRIIPKKRYLEVWVRR